MGRTFWNENTTRQPEMLFGRGALCCMDIPLVGKGSGKMHPVTIRHLFLQDVTIVIMELQNIVQVITHIL